MSRQTQGSYIREFGTKKQVSLVGSKEGCKYINYDFEAFFENNPLILKKGQGYYELSPITGELKIK